MAADKWEAKSPERVITSNAVIFFIVDFCVLIFSGGSRSLSVGKKSPTALEIRNT